MKLQQRQVADPRAQENFEQIEGLLTALLGGDYKIRFGTATATFAASLGSNIVSVPHGLGRVPAAVFALAYSSTANVFVQQHDAATSTIVPFFVTSPISAYTGDVTFYWLVVG